MQRRQMSRQDAAPPRYLNIKIHYTFVLNTNMSQFLQIYQLDPRTQDQSDIERVIRSTLYHSQKSKICLSCTSKLKIFLSSTTNKIPINQNLLSSELVHVDMSIHDHKDDEIPSRKVFSTRVSELGMGNVQFVRDAQCGCFDTLQINF